MSTETVTSERRTGPPTRGVGIWLIPVVLFFSTFAIYALTSERAHVNTDAYAASAQAWRIATMGEPWFDGMDVTELEGTHSPASQGTWLSEAANGHVVAQRMAGPIIAGVPFYWLLAADGDDPSDFALGPGGIAASWVTAGAVVLIFLGLRRWTRESTAIAATLLFAFATPTWSVSANGLWTHPITQLGIAGAIFGSSRQRWWLAGIFLGIGMLGRPHVAVIAAILGLGLACSRRELKPAVAIGVPTTLALAALATWNYAMFGAWSIGGAYGDSRITQAAVGLSDDSGGSSQWLNYLGFLVSFDRGFLVWSPLILVMLPAVVRAWRGLPDWSKWLALGGVVYTLFQLRLNYFAGGEGFHAYRHGLELLTCLTPALAFSARRVGRAGRLAIPILGGLQLAAFTLGAVSEGFFVNLDDVWRDNGFWLALRDQPEVVGTWLVTCLGVGLVTAIALERRRIAAELTSAHR